MNRTRGCGRGLVLRMWAGTGLGGNGIKDGAISAKIHAMSIQTGLVTGDIPPTLHLSVWRCVGVCVCVCVCVLCVCFVLYVFSSNTSRVCYPPVSLEVTLSS